MIYERWMAENLIAPQNDNIPAKMRGSMLFSVRKYHSTGIHNRSSESKPPKPNSFARKCHLESNLLKLNGNCKQRP